MSKRTIFTSLTILVILGVIGFWYWRDTIFSKQILRLEILGQDNAKMGEEIEYTVKYKNNGNFVLEKPKLIFELPENSLTEDGKIRFTKDLEDIYPGSEDFIKFKGRLLGKEGDLKVARAYLSYIPHNLSARYESDTTFTTKIEIVPITLTYDIPSRIEKGKDINYVINYFSNIDYPLENISIKVDAIDGFSFESSEPQSLDNVEWKLNILKKSQGGRIKIKGFVSADAGSQLNFLAKLGMWQDGVFVVIKEANQEIDIIQPMLLISQLVNGFSNYAAYPGENLHYEIFLKNISSSPFNNLFITSKLEGSAFDFSAFQSSEGQLRTNENLITFDPSQIFKLRYLGPQQEVKVDFNVKLKNSFSGQGQVVKNKVNVFDVNQEFTVKVNSRMELSQKVYYSNQGGIKNSGPIPPEVDKTTTYTISWQVKNSFNDVKNVKVKAVLPVNIGLVDQIVPESQATNFSFDSVSREVVWSVGNISAGSASTILYFQVALTPSSFQKGSFAQLIGQATVYGEDQFTGALTQNTAPAVNTSLPDDQSNSGGGIVQ